MTFWSIAMLIGSITLAVTSTTALVTVLLRRRQARPHKPWLNRMLTQMHHADQHRGRLNPLRLGIEKP